MCSNSNIKLTRRMPFLNILASQISPVFHAHLPKHSNSCFTLYTPRSKSASEKMRSKKDNVSAVGVSSVEWVATRPTPLLLLKTIEVPFPLCNIQHHRVSFSRWSPKEQLETRDSDWGRYSARRNSSRALYHCTRVNLLTLIAHCLLVNIERPIVRPRGRIPPVQLSWTRAPVMTAPHPPPFPRFCCVYARFTIGYSRGLSCT